MQFTGNLILPILSLFLTESELSVRNNSYISTQMSPPVQYMSFWRKSSTIIQYRTCCLFATSYRGISQFLH